MRKALIATCLLPHVPRQTSVSPPDATAMVPLFSSLAESTAEAGRRSVALHTLPKAVTNFAFCGLTVGYAFAHSQGRISRKSEGVLTYPIDLVHEPRLILWRQTPNVLQKFLAIQQRGSLLPQLFGYIITIRKLLECGFSTGRIADCSGSFTHPVHDGARQEWRAERREVLQVPTNIWGYLPSSRRLP